MRTLLAALTLSALVNTGTATAAPAVKPGDVQLHMDDATRERLRVVTAPLQAVEAADSVEAIARVLDVSGLAQLDAEVLAAEASAAASAADVARLTALAAEDESASLRELQTASATAAADRSRLDLARQRLVLEWSPDKAITDSAQRRALLQALTTGQAALLRVDPLGAGAVAGGSVLLKPEAEAPPVPAEFVGTASTVDPRLQSTGVLVLARGDEATSLRPGRVLAAELESGRRVVGVTIPRSALVRSDGATWVYLLIADNELLRRQVLAPRIREDGWLVESGFEPGDELVVQGAGSLLAVERSGELPEDD